MIVTILLLATLGKPAIASERSESKPTDIGNETTLKRSSSDKAKKILTLLGNIGAGNRDIRNLIHTVDSRVDNGYLRLSEQTISDTNGKLTFRYRLGGSADPLLSASNKQGVQRLELYYTPEENSRWEAVATKKYVVVNYKIPFDKLAW